MPSFGPFWGFIYVFLPFYVFRAFMGWVDDMWIFCTCRVWVFLSLLEQDAYNAEASLIFAGAGNAIFS